MRKLPNALGMVFKTRQAQRLALRKKLIVVTSVFFVLSAFVFVWSNLFNTQKSKASATAAFAVGASTTKTGTNTSTITWNHTTPSTANQILLVSVTTLDRPVSSVKYNNVNLTLAGSATRSSMTAYIYYMKNPPTGTYSIKVTTSSNTDIVAGAEIVSGVETSATITASTNNGNSSTATTGTLTGSSSDYLFTTVGTISRTITPISGYTGTHSAGGGPYNTSAYKQAAASISGSFTLSSSGSWAVVSIFLQPYVSLPVTWKFFELKRDQTVVKIDWTTAAELNNDYFVIQRSTNGTEFVDVSRIKGNGNSSHDINYSLEDIVDARIDYYYRIMQVDYDGKRDYSAIKFVRGSKKTGTVIVYPTVVNDHINLMATQLDENETYNCTIVDLTGKVIYQEEISGSDLKEIHQIQTQSIAKGTYMIFLADQFSVIGRSKIVLN